MSDPELTRLQNLPDNFIDLFDDALQEEQNELRQHPKLKDISHNDQRYSSAEFIDSGGMKKITSYQDSVTGRTVAMATMNKCERSRDLEYFINEARIAALLEHPNIVPVYDIGVDENNQPYFTMKKLGGENLRSLLNKLRCNEAETRQNYPLTELLDIFLKVCDAISYAHSRGIVHLDLKPANIQVDEFGQVQVCDWGLARELSSQGQVSETLSEFNSTTYEGLYISKTMGEACKGTPGFMAPEQISESFGQRSIRTDIYSLGTLLYGLLTFNCPVQESDAKSMMDDTTNGNITPINSHERIIDPGLAAITSKAMALQAHDRYKSVFTLANDVRAFRNGFAPNAEEASLIKRLKLVVKRHKTLALTAFASLLLIIILVTTFIYSLNQEKNKARASEKSAINLAEKLNSEKDQRLKFNRETAPKIYATAMLSYESGAYRKALNYVEASLGLDPNLAEARFLYAILLIGELRIDEALKALKQFKPSAQNHYLINICKEIKAVWGKNYLPPLAKLYPIYLKLNRDSFTNRYFLNDHLIVKVSYSYPQQERIEFAKRYYRQVNGNQAFTFNLQKKNDGLTLSLSGNRGALALRELNNLPIYELDISHTAFESIAQIQGIPLKNLNLSHSKIADLTPLYNSKTLAVLDITNSRVYNLAPIRNTPLHTLIAGSNPISLYSLQKFKKLKRFIIPRDIYPEHKLKELNISHLVQYKD